MTKISESKRVVVLDSARGTAMLLVCLSHFAMIYSMTSGASLFVTVVNLTMVAAPTFVVVSGIMLGYFFETKKETFDLIKRRFINRGIFLLTIGRIIISGAHVLTSGGFVESLKFIYPTDVIGLSIILGPLLINKLKSRVRIALGISGMVVSWMITLLWAPENWFLDLLKEAFWGDYDVSHFHILHYTFPIFPWFSLYLVSTSFGEKVGRFMTAKRNFELRNYFLKIGVFSVAFAALTKVSLWLLQWLRWVPQKNLVLYALTSPFQKSPPSIIYFLFYGGLGFLLIFWLYHLQETPWTDFYFQLTTILGRNSLFVFMVQYYFYYMFLYMAHLSYSIYWPLYFAFSILGLLVLAKFWESRNLNRLLMIRIF